MSVGTDPQPISDTGAVESFCDTGPDEVSDRLLRSAARSSRNAMVEIDWNAPLDPTKYGCSPEWSTLFGTAYWNEMTEEQRISLTRHEFASIMSIGIWFEMMLQELVFRDQYLADYHRPEFQFAMTEVADECRHSLMFALATKKMVGTCYQPHPRLGRFAKLFKSTARNEIAYAGLDYHRAVAEMRANHHFQSMVRSGCAHLMQFLDEVGLLTPAAARIYRKVHML